MTGFERAVEELFGVPVLIRHELPAGVIFGDILPGQNLTMHPVTFIEVMAAIDAASGGRRSDPLDTLTRMLEWRVADAVRRFDLLHPEAEPFWPTIGTVLQPGNWMLTHYDAMRAEWIAVDPVMRTERTTDEFVSQWHLERRRAAA